VVPSSWCAVVVACGDVERGGGGGGVTWFVVVYGLNDGINRRSACAPLSWRFAVVPYICS